MSHRSIPASLEPVVVEQLKQKKSVRAIAEWLRSTHGLDVSHMSVHRLAERMRFEAFGVPDVDAELAEARGNVPKLLRTLEALSEQFGDLAERALAGDEQEKVAPNPTLAGRLFSRQARMICDWFRYLERLVKGRDEAWTNYRKNLSNQYDIAKFGKRQQEMDQLDKTIKTMRELELRRHSLAVGMEVPLAVAL